MTLGDLLAHHGRRKDEIKARLAEFREVGRQGDLAIFRELCFCILTANTSAKMGVTCIEAAGEELFTADADGLRGILCGRYRFWKTRPEYIIHTRNYLRETVGLRLKDKLDSLMDFHERRDFFAANKGVKGIGYKEASHFLRNIGYPGYAILDKHIVGLMHGLGVFPADKRPANRREYLELEARMREFSRRVGIDMDELDLALWSFKTGEVLK